ncbi:MAG: type IV secretion system DNA-binding domain-containing protein [Oscillospiraceae bacterium]|nr:type IV secretion system DNA-binding domain-containing protein [Oscillospiraceae bacterium]
MRKGKSPLPQPAPPPAGTLIGYAGRREVYIPDNAKHVFVCGTTGSGKTVALSNFIKNAIDNNMPALIIDGKGDMGEGSLLDIVQKLNRKQKKVYVVNLSDPEKSDIYNPFLGASSAMATDMLINMTDWSEEHYKLNTERYIQRILQLLELGQYSLSFRKIIKCMKADNFTSLSTHLLAKELITKQEHLDNMDLLKTSGKVAQNSVARFSTIAESQAGKILCDDGINIAQALKENAIILFILNPMLYPELSPAFGRLVLIDRKIAIGELFHTKIPRTFFILDEISSYATTALTDLVNKSRSANVTCVLATQSLSDLDFAVNEAYKEQVIENCNNYLVLRQNSGVNAEHWANILGTRATLDVTFQLQQQGHDTSQTGYGSARGCGNFFITQTILKQCRLAKGSFFLVIQARIAG